MCYLEYLFTVGLVAQSVRPLTFCMQWASCEGSRVLSLSWPSQVCRQFEFCPVGSTQPWMELFCFNSQRRHTNIFLSSILSFIPHLSMNWSIYRFICRSIWQSESVFIYDLIHIIVTGNILTHFPMDKMDAISQTIFSDEFSLMKRFVLWSKFHWSLFVRAQMTITQHWFR